MKDKVKICPGCGTTNNEFATFCTNKDCRGSLAYVRVKENTPFESEQPEQGEANMNKEERPIVPPTEVFNAEAILEHTGPPLLKLGISNGDIAGRAGNIDLSPLKNSNFISGEHAQFIFREGNWFIKNLSQTNKTFVNGEEVALGSEHKLYGGDQIILANTYFVFRVDS